MEDFYSNVYLKLFLTFLVFVLVPLNIAAAKKSKRNKPNLPPGPWKLPVIGNVHQLAHPLPHHRLRDMAAKYGDMMHLQLGELSYIVVSSAEVASEMLRTHDAKFSQRPSLISAGFYNAKTLFFAHYGDYWRHLRKICVQEMLNPARVRSFQSLRTEEVSSLVKHLHSASGTPINLSEKLFKMTYGITARAAFGKKCKAQDTFVELISTGVKIAGFLNVAELFPSQKWVPWITGSGPKLEKTLMMIDRVLQDIVENCLAGRVEESTKGNSLLDILLDINEKNDFSFPIEAQNIRAVMLDMFAAGSDTSATTMEWTMFELLRNPIVMKKVQAEVRRVFSGEREIHEAHLHELTYLDCVVKETLRLHTPGPLLPRETLESCVINGYDIPVKTTILVNTWAIARDSRYWTDPEKYYPDRFIDSEVDFKGTDFELLPFGAGRRICPGIPFAMPNIKLPLAHLLFHFDWKFGNGDRAHNDASDIESFGMTVRLKDELYVIPIPRSTASMSIG